DSDGYIARDGSPSVTTASEEMAQDLAALMSVLGYQPSMCRKQPRGKGRLATWTVQLCPLPEVERLAADVRPHMASALRRERLRGGSTRQTALRLPVHAWREVLRDLGVVGRRGRKGAGPGACAAEMNR